MCCIFGYVQHSIEFQVGFVELLPDWKYQHKEPQLKEFSSLEHLSSNIWNLDRWKKGGCKEFRPTATRMGSQRWGMKLQAAWKPMAKRNLRNSSQSWGFDPEFISNWNTIEIDELQRRNEPVAMKTISSDGNIWTLIPNRPSLFRFLLRFLFGFFNYSTILLRWLSKRTRSFMVSFIPSRCVFLTWDFGPTLSRSPPSLQRC